MKTQKRLLCLLLCCMVLCLAACTPAAEEDTTTTTTSGGVPQTPAAELSPEPEETETPEPDLQSIYYNYSDYENILQQVFDNAADTMGGEYLLYAVYDMDGDGVLELLVLDGTCEADYTWNVYTMSELGAVPMGAFSGSHSLLYYDEEPGVVCLHGHMGYEEIERVTIDGEYITVQTLVQRELGPEEDYDTPGTALTTTFITDHSLIPGA